MLGLDFAPASSAEADLNLARAVGGRVTQTEQNRESSVSSFHYGNGGTKFQKIGDFVFGAVGSFTDCSKPLAAQVRHRGFVLWRICSLQVRHGTDSLRRDVRSLSGSAPLAVSVVPFAGQAHSRQARNAASVPSAFL
jgi:hypothetical protein